ncbi:MAG TPA: DUF6259 domain-containing protein [Acidimicrobiales bacterium]|nr:DUF6259 domain-containing protein [Acidimicrobiales bacterium]
MTGAVLDNGLLRLGFSPGGGLVSFVPARTGDEYLKGLREPVSPFTVYVDAPGAAVPGGDGEEPSGDIVELVERYVRPAGEVEAVPVAARVSVAAGVATVRCDEVRTTTGEVLAVGATLRVALVPGQAESTWSVTVDNRTDDRTVYAVTVPRLHGLRLGTRFEDDALYCPFRGGERFPSAVQDFADMAEGRLPAAEMGQPRVRTRDGRYVYELPYAGRASMPWFTYVDGDPGSSDGVYLASHDPEFLVTVLHADTAGPGAGAMNLELRKWVTVGPGSSWTSAEYVVAATGSDWHAAAARYRAWFDTQVPLSFHGGALRDTVGVYLPFMKVADGRVAYRYDDLPALYERAAAAGLDQLMPYGWMAGGFDTTYPEFFPDIELGGPMAMARAHDGVHARGGRVVTYLNSRIFNRRVSCFDRVGAPWAAKAHDGTAWSERYGAESFAVMCPGAPGWAALLADLAENMVRAYGTDVVYFDQLAAMAVPCHDPAHGHDQTGLRNQQYAAVLAGAAAACRSANPEVAFSIEQASDLFAPHVLFQGTLGVWLAGTRFNFPELYKFTFPEVLGLSFVFFTQRLPGSLFSPFPLLSRDEAEAWLCRDILSGAVFGTLDENFADQPWWDEAVGLLALRRAATPWIGHGVFRDDVDVVNAPEGMEVKTYSLDGDVLVGVSNPSLVPGARVAVRAPAANAGFRLHADGSRTAVPVAAGEGAGEGAGKGAGKGAVVEFEVPAERLSMTVLVP